MGCIKSRYFVEFQAITLCILSRLGRNDTASFETWPKSLFLMAASKESTKACPIPPSIKPMTSAFHHSFAIETAESSSLGLSRAFRPNLLAFHPTRLQFAPKVCDSALFLAP